MDIYVFFSPEAITMEKEVKPQLSEYGTWIYQGNSEFYAYFEDDRSAMHAITVRCNEYRDMANECFERWENGTPRKRKHSNYFKDVSNVNEIDIALFCELVKIEDSTGLLQQAVKKISQAGKRNGGKSQAQDLREAIDSITRKLEIMEIIDEQSMLELDKSTNI